MCPIAFFHRETPKIVFNILRNPLSMKMFAGQKKVDKWSEIKLLLNYCKEILFVTELPCAHMSHICTNK